MKQSSLLSTQSIETLDLLVQQFKALEQVAIISVTDQNGVITDINENFCRVSGYTREEIIGRTHRLINSGHHPPDFFARLWSAITEGKIWQEKIKNRAKQGEFFWLDGPIVPIRDQNGAIYRFLSFRFNVTNAMKIEEQLLKTQETSFHIGRLAALGEMAASVAHEINNPLAVISGSTTQLEDAFKEALDPSAAPLDLTSLTRCAQRIHRQTVRINKIVTNLKDFSRMTGECEREQIRVAEVLDTAIALCQDRLNGQQVKVEKKIDDSTLLCNRLQFEQIFVNLLQNAGDAIENLEDRWIRIETKVLPGLVEVSVTDSGAGVTAETAKKMFQPFFTTKPVGKGTGLGCSISRGIVERHHGKLYFDFSAAHTRFVMFFPVPEIQIRAPELIAHQEAWLRWFKNYLQCYDGVLLAEMLANECPVSLWLQEQAASAAIDPQIEMIRKLNHAFITRASVLLLRVQKNDGAEQISDLIASGSSFQEAANQLLEALREIENLSPIQRRMTAPLAA